jgi:16S rRNA (cytidine1402-2'-O)-methyltransferase
LPAEDTRHTGKLLQHFDIPTPQISYHEHNRLSRLNELLNILSQGEDIALVTDAGMPGISDPGYELIKACIEARYRSGSHPRSNGGNYCFSGVGITHGKILF